MPVSPKMETVRVLVVDDHRENLVALRSILEKLDCQVMEALSGADALALVLKYEFAVILLDVMMPMMDGFETARFIRDRKASKETPIIFLTANGGDTEFVSKGYSEGAVDYLVKPIDPGIVKAKVAVFINLFRREQRIVRQEEKLREAERERGDRALQRSEAFYEATFNHAPVGIVHTGIDGRWLRVNDGFCDIVGYSRAELIGLGFEDLTHPDDVDGSGLKELLSGVIQTYRREKRYVRKDGRPVWVQLTVSLASNDSKERHFIAIVQDITERKVDDDRKHFLATASESLLSSLDYEITVRNVAALAVPALADWCTIDVAFDGSPPKELVVLHADPAKIELVREFRRRLFDDSRSAPAKVFRTKQGELIGDARHSAFCGEAPDSDLARLTREIGLESSIVVPLVARGHVLGAIMLGLEDRGYRYGKADLGMAEDLAHRVAFALDNARLYREAQSAIEVRDDFLSIASHELRTPLTPLQLTLQRLLSHTSRDSLEKVPRERLRAIVFQSEKQVQRLVALIETLLDVSRVAAGGMQLVLDEVDLVEVTNDVAARFTDELARAQCELRVSAERPIKGRWDRLRIEQVMTNLVGNAVKYGAGKPIEVVLASGPRMAVVTVRDQGIGIEADKLPRLFGRFERAASARSYGGLGLGLYIVRQIIEAHGGTIRVTSEQGVGSSFTIELPWSGESDTASAAIEAKDPRPNESAHR